MKISQINAYPADGRTQVNIVVDSELSVSEALSSVLALFAPKPDYDLLFQGSHLVGAKPAEAPPAAVNDAEANVVDEPAPKAARTRRPRAATNAPDAALGPVADTLEDRQTHAAIHDQPVPSAEPRRRTRVTAEAPAETVKTITDADLARACSNAAAIVGIEVVQAVVNDFAVKNMQELAPDVRERFLSELEDEIKLAKEEFARAGK